MLESTIRYATLSNGMRCVARMGAMPVEHCGVAVNAGSRDEVPGCHGLAHFVEHTIFKGTIRHRASYIRDRMETIGGELNAYTTKEETVVYSTAPAGHLARALALLSEMVMDSSFPQAELAREKLVVGEEIDTYLDTPAEAVFDDFEDLIYAGSALAHNILGTRESLSGFDSEACRGYLEERFTPGRMVFFYYGPEKPDVVFARAEKYFSSFYRPDKPLLRSEPPINSPFSVVNDKVDSYQAHTLIGVRVPGLLDSRRFSVALLANILGGPGMNSLLNVALRERRGLVYATDASTSLMSDNGLLTIYFGCDPDDVARCLRIIDRVIAKLVENGMGRRKLESAKRQFIGQLTVGSVNSEQVAISMGRGTLYHGNVMTLSDTVSAINSITDEALRVAAAQLSTYSRLTMI